MKTFIKFLKFGFAAKITAILFGIMDVRFNKPECFEDGAVLFEGSNGFIMFHQNYDGTYWISESDVANSVLLGEGSNEGPTLTGGLGHIRSQLIKWAQETEAHTEAYKARVASMGVQA